jgi:3alpha(or 20beta)-hydroxysteroid dehydrogenase
VVFLASDESSFSTGSEFIIDGSQTAGAVIRGFENERATA